MAQQQPPRVQQLLGRAATDPALPQRLAADPLGTAQAEGVPLDARHLKALLGAPDASDAELVKMLRARVSHASTHCRWDPRCSG